MRVLFATTRGAGHFTPLVPLARACVRAGHEILVAAPPEAAPLAAHAGLPFEAVGALDAAAADAAFAPVFGPRDAAPDAAFVINELFGGVYARAALTGTLALVERWRPDVIVRETMEFASALAAERFGVRQVRVGVHLEAALDGNHGPLALAAPVLAALRPAAGLPDGDPLAAIAASDVLTLAPASLDAPGAPAVRRYRHPVATANGSPVWPDAEDRRPLVFVAFGSEAARGAYFPGVYRDAIEALADLPVRVLVALGHRRRPDELGPVPGAARVVGWVPQAAALHEAAVFVGHGGSGSTLAALAAGVPQVLLGLFVDGPRNAERVAALDAGIAARSPGEVGDAVAAVLAGERFRSGAGRIAAEIAAQPPIDDAVQSL
jgi:UDP:flavonoid glycosyltransferase YjiC (YdhE family)